MKLQPCDFYKKQLTIYAIYYNPSDYPGKYVVRRWVGLEPDAEPLIVTDTLDFAREAVPWGLVSVIPDAGDDKCIIEAWL